MELVREIITLPAIWRSAADDFGGDSGQFEPPDHPAIWYVLGRDGEELLGLWMFMPENSICWDVHTCLLPSAYGPVSREATSKMVAWIWENTPCQRIVTKVPVFNRLAMALAKDVGLVEYGRNPKSFLKGGVLHEQVLLGISAPEPKREVD